MRGLLGQMKANVEATTMAHNKCKKMSGSASSSALTDTTVPRPERAAGLPRDGITMPRDR